jgi:hypothetical protein
MKVYVNSEKQQDLHLEPVKCGSFNRVTEWMNKCDCMFITAFRSEYSKSQNIERNKQLAQDIHNSDLTYFKCHGGFIELNKKTNKKVRVTEQTFCVVNNGYSTINFIKLAVAWCKKYDQDAVLVTFPVEETVNGRKVFNIIGRYYKQDGSIDMEFNNAELKEAEEYFTNIYHKDFVLSSTMTMVATVLEPYDGTVQYVKASRRFKSKYPNL